MFSLNNREASPITFDGLTAKQLERLTAAFGQAGIKIITRTSQSPNAGPKTADYTYTAYTFLNLYQLASLIRTTDFLDLFEERSTVSLIYGHMDVQSQNLSVIAHATLMDLQDTAGL